MRFLLASLALVTVLAAGGQGRAEDVTAQDTAPAPASGGLSTGRCLEEPMSLAVAIAEYEASRALPARAVSSRSDLVAPTAAAPSGTVPHAPPGRTCLSPTDPGCQFQAPLPTRAPVHFERADHAAALPPSVEPSVPPAACGRYAITADPGRPLEGHLVPRWRPPPA